MNNIEKYKLKDIGKWEDRIYDHKAVFGESGYPIEAGRYELITYGAEILSQYVEISLCVSGLKASIDIKRLDPFSEEDDALIEKYFKNTNPELKLDYTLPFLIDKRSGIIISNDPFDIVKVFETIWSDNSSLRSYESEKYHNEIFRDLIMEGYRAGFAEEQIEYDMGYQSVFRELDLLEEALSEKKYLCGDELSDADILLFTFLARFDIQYVAAFRINRNLLKDMPNLWSYAKKLYAHEYFAETTDFEAIKKYAFLRTVATNPYNKLPLGLQTDDWEN